MCGQVNLVLKFNTNERWSVKLAEFYPTSPQSVTSDLKKIATVLCCGHKSIKNPSPYPTSRETKMEWLSQSTLRAWGLLAIFSRHCEKAKCNPQMDFILGMKAWLHPWLSSLSPLPSYWYLHEQHREKANLSVGLSLHRIWRVVSSHMQTSQGTGLEVIFSEVKGSAPEQLLSEVIQLLLMVYSA